MCMLLYATSIVLQSYTIDVLANFADPYSYANDVFPSLFFILSNKLWLLRFAWYSLSIQHRLFAGDEKMDTRCTFIPAVCIEIRYADFFADAIQKFFIVFTRRIIVG